MSNCISSRTPLRGAWIEIIRANRIADFYKRRTPLRGAWIEMIMCASIFEKIASHPAQGCVD